MKPNKGKYIKHVELIPESEFKKLGVFQSMICQFKEHSDVKGHDINMQLVLSGDDGELKTMGIDDIVCRKEDFIDAFSDGRTLVAVKLLWSDGTWEYGLKLWQHAERVYRRNCRHGNRVTVQHELTIGKLYICFKKVFSRFLGNKREYNRVFFVLG